MLDCKRAFTFVADWLAIAKYWSCIEDTAPAKEHDMKEVSLEVVLPCSQH